MAGQAVVSPMPCSLARSPAMPVLRKHPAPSSSNNGFRGGAFRRVPTQLKVATKEPEVGRRSGNYSPTIWDYDLLQSYPTDYDTHDEKLIKQVEKLKDDVKGLFSGKTDPLGKLELIDSVQRLGLEYHFEKEIKTVIDSLYHEDAEHPSWTNGDLYTTALKFRLFREKGLIVSPNVFQCFMDKNGEFYESFNEDVKTLLTLYDASFLAYEDEATIDEARRYTNNQLTNLSQRSVLSRTWARKVDHALDVPLHWRLNRLEARWFIDTYEQESNMNQSLLDLAKLEYNIVQSIHLQEVKELIRWWLDMGLNSFTFARDRILEHYLWCSSMVHEPQFRNHRLGLTKITSIISLVDDVYDIYGSPEELELITDFVNRWDMSRIDELPTPMRIIFLAMFNTSNEIGYMSLKDQGFNTVPYINRAWADVCKTYLKEAQWYNEGYIPTLEQYLRNSVISITSPLMLMVSYILVSETITKEALEHILDVPPIVHSTGTLVRLTNDLGTSRDELARGDNVKSIQCYMSETGVTEEVAREHIEDLIEKAWKISNKSLTANYPYSEPVFLRSCQNLGRITQYFYGDGDGHGINPQHGTKDRLTSILLLPVPIN